MPTPNYFEVLDQPIYDRVEIPPKHCTVKLFADPIGRTIMIKELASMKYEDRTNMVLGNTLPPPSQFTIERLGCLFLHYNVPIPITGDYKSKIWYSTIIELTVAMKRWWAAPAWMIADMAAVIGSSKAMEVLRQPDHNRLLDLLQPRLNTTVEIDQQQFFEVRATIYDPLLVPVELFMYISGRMRRSTI